jgi:hypothetical protein
MSEIDGREWREETVAEGLRIRSALSNGGACVDFEIVADEIDGVKGPVVARKADGFVRFDGCMNANLVREDGVMQHFCEREDIENFGRALLRARAIAAEMMEAWCGDD